MFLTQVHEFEVGMATVTVEDQKFGSIVGTSSRNKNGLQPFITNCLRCPSIFRSGEEPIRNRLAWKPSSLKVLSLENVEASQFSCIGRYSFNYWHPFSGFRTSDVCSFLARASNDLGIVTDSQRDSGLVHIPDVWVLNFQVFTSLAEFILKGFYVFRLGCVRPASL